MPAPINKVQYLYRKNLHSEQRLMAGYYREQINHYGIPVTYFRYMTDFFAPNVSGNIGMNYTYGEAPVATFPISADINVFVSMTEDNSLLKRFGMETAANAEMYFMQDDFTESFRDLVGSPTSAFYSTQINSTIESFSGLLSAQIITGELSGMTSAYTIVPSGHTTGLFNFPFIRYPVAWNKDLAVTQYYTQRHVVGTLSGILHSNIDATGFGTVSGDIQGNLMYFSDQKDPTSLSVWKIAPRVGDFIRMREFDEDVSNYEEYEITQIDDKSLTPQGLNPLLKRYIWRCTMVRRAPSHELINGPLQQEAFTPNYLADNQWHDTVSNTQVFDYANPVDTLDNKPNEDGVYGGYGL